MLLLQAFITLMSVTGSYQVIQIKAVKYDLGGTPPNLTGPLEKNFELTDAERYKVNQLRGPESFVYHKGHIYTGLSDGRIVDISDCGVRTITRMAPPGCAGEVQCGRPLGLRMDPWGRLIVADSAKGIFRVNVETGAKEVLYSSSTPVDGSRCIFINDVIVARDGTILFTDSSRRWTRKEFLYVVLEGEATGRLLAYSDRSNKTIVVLNNLAFPNGLEFTPNEDFLLISETSRARIVQLDLRPGTTWLKLSTFAKNLPGLPDNIRASGRGTYWVAMSQARHDNMSSLIDEHADQPMMREMVAMMTNNMSQILDMSEKYGMVVELNLRGEIIRSLQDPTGERVSAVSEAQERDGFLYLGTFDKPYVSRVPLTKTFHVERFLSKIKSTCRATKINLPKLRIVLRRLVAIAELRRALLNARRRQEAEEAARRAREEANRPSTTTTTAAPLENSTLSIDNDTTTMSDLNMTSTDVTSMDVTQNVTAPDVTSTQPTSTAAGSTTTTVGIPPEEMGGGIETGWGQTTSPTTASVTANDATTPDVTSTGSTSDVTGSTESPADVTGSTESTADVTASTTMG